MRGIGGHEQDGSDIGNSSPAFRSGPNGPPHRKVAANQQGSTGVQEWLRGPDWKGISRRQGGDAGERRLRPRNPLRLLARQGGPAKRPRTRNAGRQLKAARSDRGPCA